MSFELAAPIVTPQDFNIDYPVKWCPGCGGHAVLSAIKKALPNAGVKKENIVFVSGIGCSSRFPYYINTYGFHSLHGRAPAIASGIKIANPDLSVWIVTGDGDSMAIGGNHFIHILRRNLDVNIILFNNKIYGLTKGQYSPTTPIGSITKTSPDGTIENPFLPGELAMGAQGTFFARVVDTDPKMMTEVFTKAAEHKGTSLVEVYQNCVIFNNKVHEDITGKEVREEHQIYLEHGKPMIFGKKRDKGIIQAGSKLVVVTIGENGIREDDILVHDAHSHDDTRHYMLSRMTLPDYPMAMGVIRKWKTYVYEDMLYDQIKVAKEKTNIKSVNDLLQSGNTFKVEE
ncbi:MAG: 2-oxoacid:ferredoxin oxidoreductase subunit beta [Bacteroidales bacterium]|nr:2-oxoacid:ferredoxin oxidoreductase subunit beta [Bacteroidales bacterium]MBN2819322.1 2-oxoacid:ferredoxin oxidoreductase subunit beta [Bacteroidales bacterium]